LDTVAVHQGLQRQRSLVFPGGGDDGLFYLHRWQRVANPRRGVNV
jgi:hypothetical protein